MYGYFMHGGISRRDVLKGSVAAFAATLPVGAMEAAFAKAPADPRWPLADRLADLVIPPTDTPGGSVAGAGAFLLFAIDHGMSGLKPKDYTDVATALDAAAGAGGFLHLSRARQEALLTAFDAQAFGPSASDPAAVAWRALKPAIVVGYYSSEIGASQELVFEAVPGPERRNFKLSADYRARSNEGFGGGF